jgi:hypothetical protein
VEEGDADGSQQPIAILTLQSAYQNHEPKQRRCRPTSALHFKLLHTQPAHLLYL